MLREYVSPVSPLFGLVRGLGGLAGVIHNMRSRVVIGSKAAVITYRNLRPLLPLQQMFDAEKSGHQLGAEIIRFPRHRHGEYDLCKVEVIWEMPDCCA